ncbi:PQQ-binding-like beta-propeller repeat protein [Myxococcota bacterium]
MKFICVSCIVVFTLMLSGCNGKDEEENGATCGDGVIEKLETCDPPSNCPTSCDDEDPCTIDTMVGSPENCDVACGRQPIDDCIDDDGCCPISCDLGTDNDCTTKTWAKSYGAALDESAISVIKTSDGGYIVGGYTQSFGEGENDLFILKLGESGDIVWQNSYGTSEGESTRKIVIANDGGFIVADTYALVLKLDANGNIEWQKDYNDSDSRVLMDIEQSLSGGYILVGSTSIPGGEPDAWVVEIDEGGTIEWQKSYDGHGNDAGYKVIKSSGGGYVLVGRFDGSLGVMKISFVGEIVWKRTFNVGNFNRIQQTLDDGYILVGDSGRVLKMDVNGEALWSKTYRGNGTDWLYDVLQNADGSYLICGSTNSFGAGEYDAWIIKLDDEGVVMWQKTYGGTGNDRFSSFVETQEGGYVVAGNTESYGGGQYDIWVLKLDSEGNVDGDCPPGFGVESSAAVHTVSVTPSVPDISATDLSSTAVETNIVPITSSAAVAEQCGE